MISHRLWILLLYKKCKKTVEKVEDGNVLKQVLLSEIENVNGCCVYVIVTTLLLIFFRMYITSSF